MLGTNQSIYKGSYFCKQCVFRLVYLGVICDGCCNDDFLLVFGDFDPQVKGHVSLWAVGYV